MKKLFIYFLLSIFGLSISAQIPDISSLSDQEKVAYLKNLSASDRELILRTLQGNQSSDEPLNEIQVVEPRSEAVETLENIDEKNSFLREQNDCLLRYQQYQQETGGTTNAGDESDEKKKYIDDCLKSAKPGSIEQIENLKPFGYDIFAGSPTTFAPATEIPIPQNYILGPGDTLKVFTYGNESDSRDYVVDRDGVINLNRIGPVVVAGMSFSEVKQAIDDRFSTQMIGVKASVTMGELRSVRVFILGEANRSGSYTVSSLSTITNALFVSGGVKKIGSLRNIQLKRNGKTVNTLDLYDLLLKGDTSKDVRLQPGDVIFIPTVGDLVSVAGNVKRPAIYEVKREHHLEDFIKLAGGVLSNANLDDVKITRIKDNKSREILTIDYSTNAGQQIKVKAGDIIEVNEVLSDIGNSVAIEGHVKRPGERAYFTGMKVLDLLGDAKSLKEKVDLDYALVRRLVPPANKIEVFSFSPRTALSQPLSIENFNLQAHDTVYIFELGGNREAVVKPLIDELEQQSGGDSLFKRVTVSGRIKIAGDYPLEKNMTVSDLISAAGGLSDSAYRLEAEITRDELDENSEIIVRHIKVDLQSLLNGDSSADNFLQSRDRLYIKEVPNWSENFTVEIIGEVSFPGVYAIKSAETLGQVLQRAGGLNTAAFPQGSIFVRESLREKEKTYLLSLADRLEKDIALLSIEKNTSAVETGESLLAQLRETEAMGRLVIDLEMVMSNVGNELKDIYLQDGDKLYVPEKTQEVTVIGEVQFPTSHLFDGFSTRESYISKSGGFTSRADHKRIYVVRANGSVITSERSAWFARNNNLNIQPGDTIVVPLDAYRVRPITLWSSVAQILSQIGLFAASAKTVGLL